PKINDLHVRIGDNVRFDEESLSYYAMSHGHVLYEKGVLSVSPVLVVRGNVDLSQGNIRFVGSVEISGDVLDDFEVTANEGISIGGTVEGSRLKSEKDINIGGGVAGKGKAVIEANGNIHSRYFNEATVTAIGDVIVDKEIVNSKVYSMGRVICNTGVIVGSEVVALRGILTKDAGSEMGVKTSLIAGMDYNVKEKLVGVNHELNRAYEREQVLLDRVGPMLSRALKMPVVDDRLRTSIDDLMLSVRALHKQIVTLEAESGELSRSFEDKATECVTVKGDLYQSVTIIAGKFETESKAVLKGPMSFIPDKVHNMLRPERGELIHKLWEGGTLEISPEPDKAQ
ncbi:MAG: DUF342 domain-containing protein, partial [Planctomycetes bacterium]|nr:DUF342 domain-containing protein [Planctomycetota bacterium]